MTPHRRSDRESPDAPPRRAGRSRRGLLLLLGLALGAGLALDRAGVLDWRAGLALAAGQADRWWLPPALALATALLYAASLPGSLMVWIAALLLPPAIAAPVFVAGAVAGSAGACAAARLAAGAGGRASGDHRLLRLLARRGDFATLLAVRLVPGFPHSAINLAAGLLRVPWPRFLATTALGFALKGTLYVFALHGATHLAALDEAIGWRTWAPLAAVSVLLLLGPPLLRRCRESRPATPLPVEPN